MIMMDGMAFMRSNSSRSISASAAERTLLLKALAKHMGVLDTRENDAQTVLRKSELWDDITRLFNTYTTTPRSRQQIQTLYKNMKAKARRYEARLAEMANGIPPPDPDPISEMLLELLHLQLRNQQMQLRNLVARDPAGIAPKMDPSVPIPPFPYICPEQMMQVSLSEGTSEEMDIKSELEEHEENDRSETSDHDSDNSNPIPFPGIPPMPELNHSLPLDSPESNAIPKSFENIVSSPATDTASTSFEDGSEESPLIQTTLSNGTPNASENENQTQQSLPVFPVPSPTVTQPFHIGLNERGLPSVPNNIFPLARPNSNTSDLFAALRGFNPLEEFPLRKTPADLGPGNMTPMPKRPRLDSISRNCAVSGNQRFGCCCPEIHTKMMSMAQEEHQLRMSLIKKEMEQKDKEHTAKMKNLMLEEEEVRLRTEKLRNLLPNHTEAYSNQDAISVETHEREDAQNGLVYDFN